MVMAEAPATKTTAELLGVPPAPKQGRGRLVATAIDLFYRHGFNAIGLDRIIAEAGVSKTTFYKHFESKDELMVEAVRQRDAWETQAWRRAAERRAGGEPRAMLRAMFEVLDEWFNAPDFGGCMFINAASEFPNPHDPVHEAAAAHKQRARDDVRDLARAAGADDPETFADLYCTLFEGTLVMRQVLGRNDAARCALIAVEQLIDRYIPADGVGASTPDGNARKVSRRRTQS